MEYAGFLKRFLAAILDSILLGVINTVVGLIVGFVLGMALGGGEGTEAIAGLVGFVVGAVIGWVYFAGMESSDAQATVGKMALGIKVTDLDGAPVSFLRATGRHFGKYLSMIIFGIGFLMVAFTQRKQGLHDILAGCLVVRK
jgi:uncharacterized RDD family membrane protein YckC